MDVNQVKQLVERIGPHIDARYDYTYPPDFLAERTDVCVVRRLAENGSSYGYDTLYLVWESSEGLKYLKIADTQSSKDYLNVDTIQEVGDEIVVEYGSGGSFSGQSWKRTYRVSKRDLGFK